MTFATEEATHLGVCSAPQVAVAEGEARAEEHRRCSIKKQTATQHIGCLSV